MRVSARTDRLNKQTPNSEISVRSLASRQGALDSKNVTDYIFQSTHDDEGTLFSDCQLRLKLQICTMCVGKIFALSFQVCSNQIQHTLLSKNKIWSDYCCCKGFQTISAPVRVFIYYFLTRTQMTYKIENITRKKTLYKTYIFDTATRWLYTWITWQYYE